jgi:hypothetical protein
VRRAGQAPFAQRFPQLGFFGGGTFARVASLKASKPPTATHGEADHAG